MKRRLFIDSSVTPTEALLRKQSERALDYYHVIVGTSGEYRKQWQYSRGNGWTLKVDDMRKALYYLIAFDDGIEISLTVRNEERAAFLENKECEGLYPELEAATKYSEGYALRFEIESQAQCKSVIKFISELKKVRPISTMLTEKQKIRLNAKESKSGR
jgi:Protein of unknown function (DUF3788)